MKYSQAVRRAIAVAAQHSNSNNSPLLRKNYSSIFTTSTITTATLQGRRHVRTFSSVPRLFVAQTTTTTTTAADVPPNKSDNSTTKETKATNNNNNGATGVEGEGAATTTATATTTTTAGSKKSAFETEYYKHFKDPKRNVEDLMRELDEWQKKNRWYHHLWKDRIVFYGTFFLMPRGWYTFLFALGLLIAYFIFVTLPRMEQIRK
eukprot:GEZU01040940.1.p1 GENE.GEZU01040940.1~~GEZU01040940.1.p1  ORF type:complete len:206 (-),score=43.54 GEZU01040940.1:117-734(-)